MNAVPVSVVSMKTLDAGQNIFLIQSIYAHVLCTIT
jgi:hypothetical protein